MTNIAQQLVDRDATVLVYGASDDLIELNGAIVEEFNYDSEDPAYLAFSTGVVLRVFCDRNGIWRFSPISGASSISLDYCDNIYEDDGYSDQVWLHGPAPTWVVFTKSVTFAVKKVSR